MKILVCCESSGIVRDAFTAAGHDAMSCDLKQTKSPGKHYKGNALDLLYNEYFDLVIAHPPCTFLCKAQLFRCIPGSIYEIEQYKAFQFFLDIYCSPQLHIVIENPIGALSRLFRPPDQIIYPWWFGNDHSKDICLWLKNVSPLIATCYSPGRRSMSNHTNSRMSQAKRSEIRSRFFPEVAAAMASQWTEIHILS